MGKLLNNDTNYRVVAGEKLDAAVPVGIRNTDGKVYKFKAGVSTDKYIGWSAQEVAAGEVAAVIRNGKVGAVTTTLAAGKLLTVNSSGVLAEASNAGDVIVGFVPFGGKDGLEPTQVFILVDDIPDGTGTTYTLPAATAAAIGGVKQAALVADPAEETAAAIKTTVEALIDALQTAGIMATA